MRSLLLCGVTACSFFLSQPLSAQMANDPIVAQSMADDLGISMAEAERRMGLLQEANDIAKRMKLDIGVRYGGLRVTNDQSFKVEFLVTGNPERVLAAYTNKPEFTAVQVSRSYQALKAKHDRLVEALSGSEDTYMIAVIPAENRVRVSLPPTERARGRLRNTNLVDDAVSIEEEDAPAIPVATCRGGAGLTGSHDLATSGFVVTDNLQNGSDGKPRRGMVTAAHLAECVSTSCNGTTSTISGCTKNASVRDDASGVNFVFVRQRYDTSWDIEFRVPSTSGHTLTNQIVYAGTPMSITATSNPRNWEENTFTACKQGRKTGYTCALVTSNYATLVRPGGNGTFIMMEKANTSLVGPGDSGGPVFTMNNAVGITTLAGGRVGDCGSSSAYWTKLYFQPVDNLSALNISILTTP